MPCNWYRVHRINRPDVRRKSECDSGSDIWRIDLAAIRPNGLTVAERDILASLLAGATYIDIAGSRQVSFHTVASQAQTIYRKLGVRSRIELAGQLYGK